MGCAGFGLRLIELDIRSTSRPRHGSFCRLQIHNNKLVWCPPLCLSFIVLFLSSSLPVFLPQFLDCRDRPPACLGQAGIRKLRTIHTNDRSVFFSWPPSTEVSLLVRVQAATVGFLPEIQKRLQKGQSNLGGYLQSLASHPSPVCPDSWVSACQLYLFHQH